MGCLSFHAHLASCTVVPSVGVLVAPAVLNEVETQQIYSARQDLMTVSLKNDVHQTVSLKNDVHQTSCTHPVIGDHRTANKINALSPLSLVKDHRLHLPDPP